MKYFKIKNLIVLLVFTVIISILNSIWTSDTGWIPFMVLFYVIFSITFWVILSLISFLKKAHLKNEIYFYIGVGILQIILTIEYFKLDIFNKNISDLTMWIPYIITILFYLLPIKRIWENNKKLS